ncbi:MAG: putative phosphosugar-binding protein [Algoriphagus sp.]|jgi:uncharacterized phosphosugar-binding protein
MDPIDQFLNHSSQIIERIKSQKNTLEKVAQIFAKTILAGRMVHVFGSGHSRIMVEEMWPRYGSFPGFNPIVELSLTFHNLVVGANGQRQAMFLENVSGLAEQIIRNFDVTQADAALIISSSGTNVVPVEMAEIFKSKGIPVVALITKEHSAKSGSKRSDGKKLSDFADFIIDTGAPAGDAMVTVDGLETKVSPGSTVGGALLINCIKAEVANILTKAGKPPKVLTAVSSVGAEMAKELFQAAYDEHGHRVARMYANNGATSYVSEENMKGL